MFMVPSAFQVEGKAILSTTENVFFSPLQRLQRDLTIELIRELVRERQREGRTDGITILDAFSGCGVRAIRYAFEIDGVRSVLANDVSVSAIAALQINVAANIQEAKDNGHPLPSIEIRHSDATLCLNSASFDVIDLDPCGSPSPYIFSAVRSIKHGGLLFVACTDHKDLLGIGGGEAVSRTFARYGGLVGQNKKQTAFNAEVAIRTVLNCITDSAESLGRKVEYIVSVALDYFIRVAVRVLDNSTSISRTPAMIVWRNLREDKFKGWYAVQILGESIKKPVHDMPTNCEVLGPMYSGIRTCDVPFLERVTHNIEERSSKQFECEDRGIVLIRGDPPLRWNVGTQCEERSIDDVFVRSPIGKMQNRRSFNRGETCQEQESASRFHVKALLNQIIQEAQIEAYFPYQIDEIAGVSSHTALLGLNRCDVIEMLLRDNFTVVPALFDRQGIKTNASHSEVCAAILKCAEVLKIGSVGILAGARDAISKTDASDLQIRKKLKCENTIEIKKSSRFRGRYFGRYDRPHSDSTSVLSGPHSSRCAIVAGAAEILTTKPCEHCIAVAALHHSSEHGSGRNLFVIPQNEVQSTTSPLMFIFESLTLALSMMRSGDALILSSGVHEVPICGLNLNMPNVTIIGCTHSKNGEERCSTVLKKDRLVQDHTTLSGTAFNAINVHACNITLSSIIIEKDGLLTGD
jgi:tRNA G26 N,N-dimethylase Trm1